MAKNSFVVEVTFNHPMINEKCDAMYISTQDRVHFYIWSFPNVSDMTFLHFQKIIIQERIGFKEVPNFYHDPSINLKPQYKF